MTDNLEKEALNRIYGELAQPVIPENLEKKVLLAVHKEIKQKEIFLGRIWATLIFVFYGAVITGIAATWISLKANGIFEIIQTAFINWDVLFSYNFFLGLLERLPLTILAVTFCAGTILVWITSIEHKERKSLLLFKFI